MTVDEGLVVIVPSRGRPAAAHDLAKTFKRTCGLRTELLFALDDDDPERAGYEGLNALVGPNATMVEALNRATAEVLARPRPPMAIGFMGDDHRPRTAGWDVDYLATLAERPGFVYGNDLVQRANLPTQIAISTSVVRALGHIAPASLRHMYVDNYWRDLGQAAGCISYLPHVVVEHLHPVAGTAPVDDGYLRVNAPEVYARDRAAFQAYMAEHGQREVLAVLQAAAAVAR